ncbi:DUF4177 domain-containing protein [Anianabacter salinae]|uniref:DUF4177 domain-containing protein n=1 Tax=Anianabacter salinae TaxID=2851023 RepID=UPI00225E3E5E|nr:DUF4177 domain-containing protein [Anianabacter salinae]MBV0911631.1 DUF4177 domain-containing protein [Anianabacter salinae]
MRYEYKVVPAPRKAAKTRGVKGTEAKFAVALSELMNEMGSQGWEYQRTDTLPCEERQGLTGRTTTFQNMLVFRRSLEPETEVQADAALARIERSEPVLAIPTFRSTARIAPLSAEAPEGDTPRLDAAHHPDPSGHAPRVDTTADH